eukprot:TRINITY_DN17912_c0_g2_i1.p1 TRINITY_DN17912_c0_g2~~TRINITY_DN17912_c0_g2_i1.p1  ORF type:complete len:485 (+),score=70.77 TRINITY_DN17912_c0_g2_i1:70-1524(+)
MAAKPAAKKTGQRRVAAKRPSTSTATKGTLNSSAKGIATAKEKTVPSKGKQNLNGSLKKRQTTTAVKPASTPAPKVEKAKEQDNTSPKTGSNSGIFGGFFSKSNDKIKDKPAAKDTKLPQSPVRGSDALSDPLEMCRVSELISSFEASPFSQPWAGNSIPNIPKGLSTELMYSKLIDFPDGTSVKVHTPQLYAWIRNFANTTITSWKQSFSLPFSGSKSSEGKSGASFAKTQDERFLVKSLTDGELRALQELLPHLKSHYHTSGTSLINPPVACYTVTPAKGKPIHFVVLCNLLPRNSGVVAIYDLKGSTQGRAASEKEHQKDVPLLKDNDWLGKVRQNGSKPLILTKSAVYASIMKQIDKDVAFFQKYDLMDYSLFVGQHPCFAKAVFGNALLVQTGTCGYYLGIIDYLQKYNTSKKIAHAAKAITNDPSTLSTVPPKTYGERFKSFMKDSVFKEGTSEPAKTKTGTAIRRRSINTSIRKHRA